MNIKELHMTTAQIWYEEPAEKWVDCLPVGNGRLGGMDNGRIWDDKLQMNEESATYDRGRNRVNHSAKENFPKIQKLMKEGKITQAENLAVMTLGATPESMGDYQTLGDVFLRATNRSGDVTDYRRWLDMEEGIVHTAYSMGESEDERELFASHPDDVMVYHTVCRAQPLDLRIKLQREHQYLNDTPVDTSTIAIHFDQAGKEVCVMLRGFVTGENAKIEVMGEFLYISNAREITLFITAATPFRFDDPKRACKEILDKASAYSYEELKQRHVADYRRLFERMHLRLTAEDVKNDIPTKDRREILRKACLSEGFDRCDSDLLLSEQLFAFARYLMISSSRKGTLPMNLQGIWCNSLQPGWGCRYTININTEMNYWPAEGFHLPECHEVLLDHLYRMLPSGQKCAKEMYGCRGFVCHHNTDVWGDCAPQDEWIPGSYWVLGGAWLCTHLWMHYEYTLDKDFLRRAWPILKESALFFVDYLQENEKGEMVIIPSVSPENSYYDDNGNYATFCCGATMDAEILRDLFDAVTSTAEILGMDADFAAEVAALREKLPPLCIGQNGQIVEWNKDFREESPGHRHISHLYALYPAHQITPKTPELYAAARQTIERRLSHGGGATGWSRAWIVCMWARLHDATKVQENLNYFLTDHIFDNLFCSHPPYLFQIDGNFGIAAGMMECLAQSEKGKITLLPVLPKTWKKQGEVRGMCLRGGYTLDMTWKDGKVTNYHVESLDKKMPQVVLP